MDELTFIGHATTLLRLGGTVALTDPAVGCWIGPLRRHGPEVEVGRLGAIDVIVISHIHRDHLDLQSLRRLPSDVPVVVPRGAGALASKAGASEVIDLAAGEATAVDELEITAVPAQHASRRGPFGTRAEPLGYVLASPRRRVYFAGDTGLFGGMGDLGPVDLALLPVWGWGPRLGSGHLTPVAAAEALTLVRPRQAVPIHWGTFYPAGLGRLFPRHLTRPPIEFARVARALAPAVDVRVLRPGETLTLAPSPSAAEARG
jgi:L-ascorbate metabolism protein UlaG (beta-lactamase superfamily)